MEKIKLNIQMFARGTIEFDDWDGSIRGKIEWWSEPISGQNKSNVTAQIYVRRPSGSTTGRQWNGYLNIGENHHTFNEIYTSKSTTVGTSWVLVEYWTDTITHDSNGSKTLRIEGNVTGPGGTSLAGKSSWGGAYVELDRLHTAPVLNYVGFTEENQTLINFGVADNQFVPYLSQKNINMNLTLYNDAILAVINWRFKDLSLDNLSLVPILSPSATPPSTTGTFTYTKLVDFADREIVYTQVGNNYYAKVGYSIIDNMSGTYVTTDNDLTQYEIIPYKKPILTNLTNAYRDGQVSGKVKLTVNGTFYNGTIGQTQNGIQVFYKFWKKNGETEPQSYIQIPSGSVTISGNSVQVNNYQIGNSDPTASNYFDYQESYYIKVIITDSAGQTAQLSENLSIPVGEATWTEYPDHVDFKKLTIQGDDLSNHGRIVADVHGNSISSITANNLNLDKDGQYEIWISFNATKSGALKMAPNGRNSVLHQYNADARLDGTNFTYYNRSLDNDYLYVGDYIHTGQSTLITFKLSKANLNNNAWYTYQYQIHNCAGGSNNKYSSWGGGQFCITSDGENITSWGFMPTSGSFSDVWMRVYKL